MTSSDKKKTLLLIVLLAVAGMAWYFAFRTPTSSETNTAGPAVPGGKSGVDGIPESRIRVDLLDDNPGADSVGRRNLFEYYTRPVPPPPAPPPSIFSQPPAPPPPTVINAAPPVQPFKAFRYEGFSVVSKTGGLLASISEGGTTYTLKEGECLMGQYCVRRLTENVIEIEDLQSKRRQSFPRVQQ